MITADEFNRRVAALGTKSKYVPAVRAVLVEGLSWRDACALHQVDLGGAFRLGLRIQSAKFCPKCGQSLPHTVK